MEQILLHASSGEWLLLEIVTWGINGSLITVTQYSWFDPCYIVINVSDILNEAIILFSAELLVARWTKPVVESWGRIHWIGRASVTFRFMSLIRKMAPSTVRKIHCHTRGVTWTTSGITMFYWMTLWSSSQAWRWSRHLSSLSCWLTTSQCFPFTRMKRPRNATWAWTHCWHSSLSFHSVLSSRGQEQLFCDFSHCTLTWLAPAVDLFKGEWIK